MPGAQVLPSQRRLSFIPSSSFSVPAQVDGIQTKLGERICHFFPTGRMDLSPTRRPGSVSFSITCPSFKAPRGSTQSADHAQPASGPQSIPQPENTTIGEEYAKGDIVIVNHERSLYFVEGPGHAIRYPVAIGTLDDQWDGVQTITAKRENPRWFPSEDIQWDRLWSLPDLKTRSGRGHFT